MLPLIEAILVEMARNPKDNDVLLLMIRYWRRENIPLDGAVIQAVRRMLIGGTCWVLLLRWGEDFLE